MKKYYLSLFVLLVWASQAGAGNYHFDFTSGKAKAGTIRIEIGTRFTEETGYGYDLIPSPDGKSDSPWFFSVSLPDGNYKVTVCIGSKKRAGCTTVRAESRRLFIDRLPTKKGEVVERSFIVNKRNPRIDAESRVRIKTREIGSLTWDDKLTIEVNGSRPLVESIRIEQAPDVPTVFLCGNSTVVDQGHDPWASWGQMIPSFFNDRLAFANYAESGESANSFMAAGRLKKILAGIKAGDYLFVEFGHNDQKQTGPGKGAYYSYMTNLKTFVDEARQKGAIPVLVTPTKRRRFDREGNLQPTLGEYPDAMKWLAEKEKVHLIDLNSMTGTLYRALGPEGSKNAFVHYPAHTFPGQSDVLEDNTHFNPYGAYEIAKCVVEGIKKLDLPLKEYIVADFTPYDPARPDAFGTYSWDPSPFFEIDKPEGN